VARFWAESLRDLATQTEDILRVADFVAQLDVLQCRSYVATRYNYCRPTVVAKASAFFNASGLRHPLIEHLSQKELYVTNDLALGEAERGLLLYGTNAVGKTSLVRAVGLAIVMAQAGLHVPCTTLEFAPYASIYTRILGNDNIFKGLSTFAVEMAELRSILAGAAKDTLVLGDELCSGTESGSAVGIFAAGVEALHQRECTFMFATHLHEVTRFSEIESLDSLAVKHLQVRYDAAKDVLVYDRRLKDGPGQARYGLEVCKSLGLPEAFLERAHSLRVKYGGEVPETVLTEKGSHFNATKLRGACEVCQKRPASQVHHLQHQAAADMDSGYIGSFHKNHKANLMAVCDGCHDRFHDGDAQHKRTKTSAGYMLEQTAINLGGV
tara:strand:- start:225 stop:1370 length:1146 start_codon:yes stop_codon:yes gene_type:complete